MKTLPVVIAMSLLLMSSEGKPQSSQGELEAQMIINTDLGREVISRHIYGHFSEHLGRCIYGGYWVGENAAG